MNMQQVRVSAYDAAAVGAYATINHRYVTLAIEAHAKNCDALEIYGVRNLEPPRPTRRSVEPVSEHPQYFSVYVHLKSGGLQVIGDFGTYPLASEYAAELAKTHGWPVRDHVPEAIRLGLANVNSAANGMRTVRVRDLQGLPLDWAVAKCRGWSKYESDAVDGRVFRRSPDGCAGLLRLEEYPVSESWALAGPIIDEQHINLQFCRDLRDRNGLYIHSHMDGREYHGYWYGDHNKPLVAILRCYVASKSRELIEIPADLLH